MNDTPAGGYGRSRSAEEAGESLGEAAAQLAGRAGRKVDEAAESAEQAARHVMHQAREAGDRVQEVAGNMRQAVDKSLAEQPMTTLLMAAAVGFVLGAIWKA